MLTPQLNPDGYEKSAVRNMTGFNHTQYLLVHGTGDDNGNTTISFALSGGRVLKLTHIFRSVHFQNAAALVDRLTLASVHGYRVQFYTDSDHSINTHNANREIYYLLTDYLWEGLVILFYQVYYMRHTTKSFYVDLVEKNMTMYDERRMDK
jgi:dipeptidyl aminopeptidase